MPKLAYNPLLKFPRNLSCPCDSGKKFKKCCLPWMPRVIDAELAKEYASAMDRPELIKFSFESHVERGDKFDANQTVSPTIVPEGDQSTIPQMKEATA